MGAVEIIKRALERERTKISEEIKNLSGELAEVDSLLSGGLEKLLNQNCTKVQELKDAKIKIGGAELEFKSLPESLREKIASQLGETKPVEKKGFKEIEPFDYSQCEKIVLGRTFYFKLGSRLAIGREGSKAGRCICGRESDRGA